MRTQNPVALLTVAVVIGMQAQLAVAVIETTDPTLPPLDPAVYLNPTHVHVLFSGPTLDLILERPEHKAILVEIRERVQPPPPGHAVAEREVFSSDLTGTAQVCPAGSGGPCGAPQIPFTLLGPTETMVLGKDLPDTTGSWQTAPG